MDKQRIELEESDVPGAKLTKSPKDCNVVELKRWLYCHGEKQSGKKQELIARVEGCIALKIKVDPKVDGGKWYDFKSKNDECANESGCLIWFPESGWKNFPSRNIPSMFNYGHVYHYLVESVQSLCSETQENVSDEDAVNVEDAVTAKPLRKGRALLNSGFLENSHDNENNDNYFLRCHVHHSMKSDFPLQVFICIGKVSGYIKQASCTCKAREVKRCCHVTAVLLMLSDYVTANGHVVVEASTSKPCSWNKGKKRTKEPKALHKSFYPSKKSKPSELYDWDPRPVSFRQKVNQTEVNDFVRNLETYSSTTGTLSMWETILQIEYKDFDINESDRIVYTSLVNDFEKALHDNLLSISQNFAVGEIPNTEKQSECDLWFQARQSRITASNCKFVVGMGEEVFQNTISRIKCYTWIEKKLWFPEQIRTFDMQYGIQKEPAARDAYTNSTGNAVRETGVWVNTKYPHLAASPDGIVPCTNWFGILEIKCLKVLKEKTVSELISAAKEWEAKQSFKKTVLLNFKWEIGSEETACILLPNSNAVADNRSRVL